MHLVEDKYICNHGVFVSLPPFVPSLKDCRHGYPLTFGGSGGMACSEVIRGVPVTLYEGPPGRLTPV